MQNEWVRYPIRRQAARLRLFCIPAAGGGVAQFRTWIRLAPPELELGLIRLPGRETRIDRPPLRDLTVLVEQLVGALDDELDVPFAIFGHSTGALIAFEVARELERLGGPRPGALFLSAQHPPHLPGPPAVSDRPAAELFAFLRELGGTPDEVLADPEMRAIALAAIRADFRLGESYRCTPGTVVHGPIQAFAGSADAFVPPHVMERWADLALGPSQLTVLPGGHFFSMRQGPAILEVVLRQCLGASEHHDW